MHPTLVVQTIVSDLFSENAYVAHLASSRECLVFDPGFDPESILNYIQQSQLSVAAILNTHGHADHIAGNAALKQAWPDAALVIGAGDAPKLTDPRLNLSAKYGFALTSPPADRLVREPDRFQAAGIELDVLEAPGHSVGHVVFLWQGGSPWVLFGGDVLFQGSIGRTDFPDGTFEQLRDAIHRKLFTLPGDTQVLCGHGPPTTIDAERRENPFVGRPAGYKV